MGCIQSKVVPLSTQEAEEKPSRRRTGSRKATFKGKIQTVFGRKNKVLPFIDLEDDEEDGAQNVPALSNMSNDAERRMLRQFTRPPWRFGDESESDQETDSEDEDLPCRVVVRALVHAEPASSQVSRPSPATKDDGDSAHDTASAMEFQPPSQSCPLTVGEEQTDPQNQASDLDGDSAHYAKSCPELPQACHSSTSQTEEWVDNACNSKSCPEFPKPCHYATMQLADEGREGAHDEVTSQSTAVVSKLTVHVKDQSESNIVDDDLDEVDIDMWPSLLFILWSTHNMAICAVICLVWDHTVRTLIARLRATAKLPGEIERVALAIPVGDDMTSENFPTNEGVGHVASGSRAFEECVGSLPPTRPPGCQEGCRCHYVEMDPDTPSTSYPRDLDAKYDFTGCYIRDDDSDDCDSDSDDEEDTSSEDTEVVSFEEYARYVAERRDNTPTRIVDVTMATEQTGEADDPTEHAHSTVNKSGEDNPSIVNDTPTDVEVTSSASQADLDEIHVDLWPSLLFILWSTQNMAICAVICFVWDRTLRTLKARLRATAKLPGEIERVALAIPVGDDMTSENFPTNEGVGHFASGSRAFEDSVESLPPTRPPGCQEGCRCHYVEMDPDEPSTSYPRNLDDTYDFIVKKRFKDVKSDDDGDDDIW